jgi:rubrerythrin
MSRSNIKKKRTKAPVLPEEHISYLIDNALQFIERGVSELLGKEDNQHLKYSVINFYTGIELVLKSRLMMEHWALIVLKPGEAKLANLIKGDFKSVGLPDIIKRLRNISSIEISKNAEDTFTLLRQHRNKMVHFFHPLDLRKKEGERQRDQIIREQCLAWYYLRQLINEEWLKQFSGFQKQISSIDSHIKGHEKFLQAVYDKIKPELLKEQENGADLEVCWYCDSNAHVISLLGPWESACRVCTAKMSFLRVQCEEDDCATNFLLNDRDDMTDCPSCGEPSSFSHAQDDYSGDSEYGNCYGCEGNHTVGSVANRSFCFRCHTFHEPMERCEYCDDLGTGLPEDSFLHGCSMCEGRIGNMKD